MLNKIVEQEAERFGVLQTGAGNQAANLLVNEGAIKAEGLQYNLSSWTPNLCNTEETNSATR